MVHDTASSMGVNNNNSNAANYVVPDVRNVDDDNARDDDNDTTPQPTFVIDASSVYAGHGGAVAAIHADDSSDTIVTGATDGVIRFWSKRATSMPLHRIDSHSGYVFALSW